MTTLPTMTAVVSDRYGPPEVAACSHSSTSGNLELSSRRLEQLTALVEAGTLTLIVGAIYLWTTSSTPTDSLKPVTSAAESRSRSSNPDGSRRRRGDHVG
jgi:hypothetical protein